VIEREFSLTPSRTTLAAGTVAIELVNRGQDPHDLRVERIADGVTHFDFALAQPGSVTSQKLNLAPGTWKLYCTLPRHDEYGMRALITVTG
jgi:plastocyanin